MLLGFDVKSMDFANPKTINILDSFINDLNNCEKEPAIIINGSFNSGKGLIMQFINNKLISDSNLRMKLAICLEILDDFSDYFKGGSNISCTLRRLNLLYQEEVVGVSINHDNFDKHAIIDRNSIFRVILRLVNSLGDDKFSEFLDDEFEELVDISDFPEVGDDFRLDYLLNLFESVQLSKAFFKEIINLLKAVILLMQFKFLVNNDEVFIKEDDRIITFVAKHLNIEREELVSKLTAKTVNDPNGEVIVSRFSMRDAVIVKERFIKHIYESLFNFLSECFDRILTPNKGEIKRTVSVIICSSFENNANFKENGLHSFLSNFCSDMCLKFYHSEIIDNEVNHIRSVLSNVHQGDLFENKLKYIEKITNSSVLSGLEQLYGKGGIFDWIEAETSITFKKTISNLIGRVNENSGLVSKTNNSFKICHLIDTVEYGNKTFLEDNVDNLQEGLAKGINKTLAKLQELVQENTTLEIKIKFGFDKSYSSFIKTKSYCQKIKKNMDDLFRGLNGKVPFFINLINVTNIDNKMRINQIARQLTVFAIEKKLLLSDFDQRNSFIEAVKEGIERTLGDGRKSHFARLNKINEKELDFSEDEESNCLSESDDEEMSGSFVERKENWKKNSIWVDAGVELSEDEHDKSEQEDNRSDENKHVSETEEPNIEEKEVTKFEEENNKQPVKRKQFEMCRSSQGELSCEQKEVTKVQDDGIEEKQSDNALNEDLKHNNFKVVSSDETSSLRLEGTRNVNLSSGFDEESEVKQSKTAVSKTESSKKSESKVFNVSSLRDEGVEISSCNKQQNSNLSSATSQFVVSNETSVDFNFEGKQSPSENPSTFSVSQQIKFEHIPKKKPVIEAASNFSISDKPKQKPTQSSNNHTTTQKATAERQNVVKKTPTPITKDLKPVPKQEKNVGILKLPKNNPAKIINNERIRISQFNMILGLNTQAKKPNDEEKPKLAKTTPLVTKAVADSPSRYKNAELSKTTFSHKKTPSIQSNKSKNVSVTSEDKPKERRVAEKSKTEKPQSRFVSKLRKEIGHEVDAKNKKNKMLEFDRKLKEQNRINYRNNLDTVESKIYKTITPKTEKTSRKRANSIVTKRVISGILKKPREAREKRSHTIILASKPNIPMGKSLFNPSKFERVAERGPKLNLTGKENTTSKHLSSKSTKNVGSRIDSGIKGKSVKPMKNLIRKSTVNHLVNQANSLFPNTMKKENSKAFSEKYNALRESSVKMLIKQHYLNYAAHKAKKKCDLMVLRDEFKMNLDLMNLATTLIENEGLWEALDYVDMTERLERLGIMKDSQLSDLVFVLWSIYCKDMNEMDEEYDGEDKNKDLLEHIADLAETADGNEKGVRFKPKFVKKRRVSIHQPKRTARRLSPVSSEKIQRSNSLNG